MKIGSLCSGYGGLDMAAEYVFNADTVWMSDIDKAASCVIDKRWNLPNLGDLKTVDWFQVEPINILTAGYPCQPFSTAGKRQGENDDRHLWPDIQKIISVLRPRLVILENVRGHLTLGFKEVLKDLTEIGYDAKWAIVRASDVGAPHQRARLFAIAYPNSSPSEQLRRASREVSRAGSQIIDRSDRQVVGFGSEAITHSTSEGLQRRGRAGLRYEQSSQMSMRRPPNPLDNDKLNPAFVEYMMGLPEGWVTNLGLSRTQQLKLLGNGVVPQQAQLALQILLERADTPKETGLKWIT